MSKSGKNNEINILDYGGVGDGVTLNTRAIQQALAAIADRGGGTLYFPAGVYRSGTIDLIDNLTVYLALGATLQASGDISDYEKDTMAVNPHQWLPYYFLQAFGKKNITLTGEGVIDGNGAAFWENVFIDGGTSRPDNAPVVHYNVLKAKADRPALAYFTACKNVRIENLTIVNSPSFTVWLIGCDHIFLHGLTVKNPRNGPNTDILDIDCSQNVCVSDCNFDAGDDCIAIKSDPHRCQLSEFHASEHIVVSNCVLSTATCAIRIGYEGDAPIRDCVFSNLTIYNARHGIDMLSITPNGLDNIIEHGTPIEQIIFSNIVMSNVGQAFFIWAGDEPPRHDHRGYIEDVIFSNIIAHSVASSYVGSRDRTAIRRLTFRDVTLHVADRPECPPDRPGKTVPSHWGGNLRSGAMVLHKVDDVAFYNVRLFSEQVGLPLLTWVDTKNFTRDGQTYPANGQLNIQK